MLDADSKIKFAVHYIFNVFFSDIPSTCRGYLKQYAASPGKSSYVYVGEPSKANTTRCNHFLSNRPVDAVPET